MGHRSIRQRMARAASFETRVEIALEWAQEWENDQRDALRHNDCGRLQEMTNKRFDGLRSVIEALAGDEDEVKP